MLQLQPKALVRCKKIGETVWLAVDMPGESAMKHKFHHSENDDGDIDDEDNEENDDDDDD